MRISDWSSDVCSSDLWQAGRVRRVSVVGVPGAGKSTVGRELARRLGSRFVELDSIHHQPGWTPLPREPFRARVAEELEADTWVVDGNYSAVQDLVWAAADTIVWLDLPRPLIMRRVAGRTLRRAITREELWKDRKSTRLNSSH